MKMMVILQFKTAEHFKFLTNFWAKNELDQVIQIVKKEMETAIKFKVPIQVDYNYGINWYEAH